MSEDKDIGETSDGYHTFNELYEHRICLFIALSRNVKRKYKVWYSKQHSDGSMYDGWFVMGIDKKAGEQITYHLPLKYLSVVESDFFIEELDKAPEWDGHTSKDVLERLLKL